jgi:hypothetical protein
MTAAEQVKRAGLKSLKQVSKMTGKPTQTLNAWHKASPDLFEIIVLGCAMHIRISKIQLEILND